MALNDFRDKLATAEGLLLCAPLHSQEWEAAREHVSWIIETRWLSMDADGRAEYRAASAAWKRVLDARWEHGMQAKYAMTTKEREHLHSYLGFHADGSRMTDEEWDTLHAGCVTGDCSQGKKEGA